MSRRSYIQCSRCKQFTFDTYQERCTNCGPTPAGATAVKVPVRDQERTFKQVHDEPQAESFKKEETLSVQEYSLAMNPFNFERDEEPWVILVQILLPMILLLMFLIVVGMLKYKLVAEEVGRENQGLRDSIEGMLHDSPKKSIYQKQDALMKLQKQRLLLALEKVKKEQREHLKISKFTSGRDVDMTGASVTDDDFRFLCIELQNRQGTKRAKSDYMTHLYRQVLKEAKVIDHRGFAVRQRINIPEPSDAEIIGGKERTISKHNRAIIQNEIVAFVRDTRVSLADLQVQVLLQVFDLLIDSPEQLDESTQKVVGQFLNPKISERERSLYAERYYRLVIKSVRQKITQYRFLPETWQKISTLS